MPFLGMAGIISSPFQRQGKQRNIQEIVDKMTAMEDTFFHKLVEDSNFCEELIQTVTGKKSIRLVEATAQKGLRNIKDFFGKGKTMYHIDRVLREMGGVVDNGFYEIYVNTEIDDNSKFPKTSAGIKNLKVGKLSVEEIAEGIPLLSLEEIFELQESVLQVS